MEYNGIQNENFFFINECFRQLISQIEAFKQTSILTSDTDSKVQNIKDDKTNKTEPGVLKYQMMYLPEKARMQEAARIALLEQRLCNLESIIGTTSDKLSKFSQVYNVIIFYIIIIINLMLYKQ